ncbi:unnamed protein product [Trichobilharzia szidati]|nr:unnamed protein product [Trichobilharzia szidati]
MHEKCHYEMIGNYNLLDSDKRHEASSCSQPLVHFNLSGEIASHHEYGVSNYAPNLYCIYQIQAPINHKIIIQIEELDLEESNGCIFDYLLITNQYYDNIYTYCGQRKSPNPVVINDSLAVIIFVTDDGNNGNGFLLKYEIQEKEDLRPNSFYSCGIAPQLSYHQSTDQDDNDVAEYKIQPRIFGGQITPSGQWPWMASIREKNQFRCGASLIDSNWLLTAAHCFPKKLNLTDWQVYVGDNYIDWIDEQEITFNIRSLLIHPNYSLHQLYDYDFALIQTDLPIQYSTKRRPVCLLNSTVAITSDQFTDCYIAGWGSSEDSPVSNALRHLNIPLLSLNECNQTEVYKGKITETMICAGYLIGGKDACKGDSGGPLMCQLKNNTVHQIWYQIGVVSFGKSCAASGTPGVYSNVTFAIDWIYSVIHP